MPQGSYQQVRDLVEHVRAMHRKVRRAVSERVGASEEERTELLLRFLEEHDRSIDAALASAGGSENGEAVLNTWLQFSPDDVASKAFRALDEPEELGDEELVERVLRAENALASLYQVLAGSTDAPRVREFFESLVEMEDAAGRRYAKARLDAQDV